MLRATGLRKRCVGKQGPVEAVRGVSLQIDAGGVLAFLGPNGAGKTTTVKMICGLVLPDEGEVRILGENPMQTPGPYGTSGPCWRATATCIGTSPR